MDPEAAFRSIRYLVGLGLPGRESSKGLVSQQLLAR
jgi:hypothetical protein